MDSSLTFYLVLGALLLGFIVLGMLKGMIRCSCSVRQCSLP